MNEYKLKDNISEDENLFAPKYDIQNEINTINELKESLPENKYKAPSALQQQETDMKSENEVVPRITIINDESDIFELSKKQRLWIDKIERLKHDEVLKRLKEGRYQATPLIKSKEIADKAKEDNRQEPKFEIKEDIIKEDIIKEDSVGVKEDMPIIISEPAPFAQELPDKKTPIIPPFREDAPFAKRQEEPVLKELIKEPEEVEIKKEENILIEEEKATVATVATEREPLVPPRRLKRLSADEILALHKKELEDKKREFSAVMVSGEDEISRADCLEEADKDIADAEKLAQLYYASEEEEYKS